MIEKLWFVVYMYGVVVTVSPVDSIETCKRSITEFKATIERQAAAGNMPKVGTKTVAPRDITALCVFKNKRPQTAFDDVH